MRLFQQGNWDKATTAGWLMPPAGQRVPGSSLTVGLFQPILHHCLV